MDTENRKNTNNNTQITFKLSIEERETIQAFLDELGLDNISEFCRLKCLSNENLVIQQNKQIENLKLENKMLSVKLSFYKNSERTTNAIVLQANELQKEIIEKLFYDYSDKNDTLGKNLIYFLLKTATADDYYDFLFKRKGITKSEIEEAMYEEIE